MTKSIIHKDKRIVVSFAEEAYENIGHALMNITSKVLKESAIEKDLSCSPLLKNAESLYPEQKSSLQKLILQTFPAIRIVLDLRANAELRNSRQIQISYKFSEVIKVLHQFIIGVDKIRHSAVLKDNDILIRYLWCLIDAAPRSIRSKYKFDCWDQRPSLLPRNGLKFFLDPNFTHNQRHNPEWFFSPVAKDRHGIMTLSYIGTIELISLFLTSERVYEFLKQTHILECFNSTASKPCLSQRQIIHSLFSCYSIHLFSSTPFVKKGSLENALEIIHNLRMCPEELYPVLPSDQQAEFNLFDVSDRRIYMRRHSDRFPQLIINYFDCNKCFEKLRFGIHVGYLSLKKHTGSYADGNQRDRYVKNNINCFCSIEDAFNFFSSLKNGTSNIHEDNISFIRNGENFAITIGNKMPVISDGRIKCHQPDCWISKYTLDFMAFYEYLCPGDSERIIINEIEKQKTAQQKNTHTKNTARYFDRLLNDTESLLDDLKKKKGIIQRGNKEIGKKRYCRIVSSEIAAFIIKDIVFWMDGTNSIDKPSGLQYAVIKGMLANLDGIQYNATEIEQALQKAGIDKAKHVILKHTHFSDNIIDLYECYLNSRRVFLSNPENREALQRKCYKSVSSNEYNPPVLLPRHLFLDQILYALKEKRITNPSLADMKNSCALDDVISKIDGNNNHSLNYIVKTFFETCFEDQSQNMYRCSRRDQYGFYRLLSRNIDFAEKVVCPDIDRKILERMINENKKREKRNPQIAYDKETFMKQLAITRNSMNLSEKAIRRHKTNDVILFLLAKSHLPEECKLLKLRDISPNGMNLQQTVIQKVSTIIENIPINISYQSSIKEAFLLFKWLHDKRFQHYLLKKQRIDESVKITSDEIDNLLNCRLRQ